MRIQTYIRAENVTKAVLDVSFADASGAETHEWATYIGNKEKDAGKLTHDWKLYSGDVSIPVGTKTITVSPQIYGPGTVWIDDISAGYVP